MFVRILQICQILFDESGCFLGVFKYSKRFLVRIFPLEMVKIAVIWHSNNYDNTLGSDQ